MPSRTNNSMRKFCSDLAVFCGNGHPSDRPVQGARSQRSETLKQKTAYPKLFKLPRPIPETLKPIPLAFTLRKKMLHPRFTRPGSGTLRGSAVPRNRPVHAFEGMVVRKTRLRPKRWPKPSNPFNNRNPTSKPRARQDSDPCKSLMPLIKPVIETP